MKYLRKFVGWLFWCTSFPFGPLAPYALGFSIGRMPHRVKDEK